MSKNIRHTPHDYHDLAARRGFTWLGPEVANAKTKTTWRCPEGHEWEAHYSNINAGKGCSYCAGRVNAKREDYITLARERGYEWLGPEVSTSIIKTRWRCSQRHEWDAPYNRMAAAPGWGCPHCAGNTRRTEADYRELARERGYEWLGPRVTNNKQRTAWRCDKGHVFEASYSNVSRDRGCPWCSKTRRPVLAEDYRTIGLSRQIECLGPIPETVMHKTRWRCIACGYTWSTSYNVIQQGNGCPSCSVRTSQAQLSLYALLGGRLNQPVGRRRIDVAIEIEDCRIAVEYDSYYWHRQFRDRTASDAARNALYQKRGWRVLCIKSNSLLPPRHHIYAAISRLLAGSWYEEIVLPDWKPAGP